MLMVAFVDVQLCPCQETLALRGYEVFAFHCGRAQCGVRATAVVVLVVLVVGDGVDTARGAIVGFGVVELTRAAIVVVGWAEVVSTVDDSTVVVVKSARCGGGTIAGAAAGGGLGQLSMMATVPAPRRTANPSTAGRFLGSDTKRRTETSDRRMSDVGHSGTWPSPSETAPAARATAAPRRST